MLSNVAENELLRDNQAFYFTVPNLSVYSVIPLLKDKHKKVQI